MKYIDADLLRKDIDTWKKVMVNEVGEYSDGVRFVLSHFSFLLDSLQQEQQEVDLDSEIERYGKKSMWLILGEEGISKCARHFYELGKNSK